MSSLSKTDEKWLSATTSLARISSHPKYLFGALVVKNGRVLARANNGRRTGRHAELRALATDVEFRGATIYVVRINKSTPTRLRCSKPCRMCFRLIRAADINKIVYISWEGTPSVSKVAKVREIAFKERKDF